MTVYNATPIEQEPVYDATPLGDKPESIDTSTWGATKSAANKVFSLDTLGSIGRGTGALAGTLVSFPASGIAGLGRLGYELSSGSGFENSMNKASETVESVMSLPAQAYLGALKPKGQAFDVMSLAPKANEITPEQQVVGIVGWPFEKLAELNKYISEGKADEPPSALRYALGAVPETVLYTVGLGTLAKYGMKPFDIKQKAKVFEQRLKVADEAKIPETVVSGEIRQPTTMSNVLSDKVLPPTTAQTRRRMRDIEGDLVKKQADQTQLTDMLQSQKEEAASGNVVIKPEDVTVQSLDSNTKLFVDNKVKELGSPEKVREVYNTDSPVDIYAREQAGKLEAPSVQKLNKGGLTPEELTKLSDTKVFLPEELAAIQKLPGFKQREQYNRVFNILPEIKADPVEIAKAEKLFGIVEENAKVRKSKVKDLNTLKKAEWSEADIAKMSEEDIAKKAKVIRGETNPLNPDGNTILKLKDAEIALNKFIEEVGGKSKLSELTDEQDARYEELVAKLRELDMDETFDPLHNVRDYLYLDEPVELQMEPGAFDARRDLLKGKAKPAPPQPGPAPIEAKTKRRRPVKMEDVEEVEHITNEDLSPVYEAKPMRSRAEELAAERAQRSGSAEDWEMALEAEGMPAELNFNAKLRRTRSQVEGERARTNVENALADIAKKRRVIRGAAEARNLLVDAYKYMPETEAEARTWAEKVKTLEDHVADKLGKRAAFTRKSIAEALAKKQITKQEAHYMNTIFNTLKQQPTMGFEFDPTMGEGREGLYTFANNLIRIKTPQALAHEVGHFAWYNVLTKEDKAAYMQDFINRYYKDGALDKSALRLATTDPFNAARNPNEMFACKFSDYMHEKVLSSTEMNLFQKVKQWFLGLKKRLGSEGTNYDGVEALFNKVLDPARRTMWSEDVGREFVEPTPGYVSDNMGVKTIRDRISMLTGLFEKAKADNQGRKILGEVKDNDWGMATELMGRPILSLDNTTVSQRLWRNLGPWIESPMSFVKGTRNERHVYNTNLAEMFISHMYDQHKTLIDAIERGVRHGDGQRENIRKVIEGKIEGNPAEKEAAVQVRDWLDTMKARYKLFLINDYKANLSKSEYGALLDIISGDDLTTVKSKYPRLATDVIEEIAAKHMEIDTWGIDNYIPNVEAGRYKILADGVTADGKPYQKLVAIGLSEKDAARKATKYLEENPEVSKLYVDTDYKMISDDKTSITSQQYYAMMHSLSKKMLESIDGIDKKVAKEMARKTLGRKFKIVPTDSYSPFLQDRANILKGEDNIFPVLRSYAHSLEKKMALDPVIDIIRKDLPKMDKHERAYILDYIEDVKGKYGKADKMVDDIFHTYRGYSRLISRARTAEAALKLGYRPVAAAVNLASGQMHAWIKRGAPMYAEGIRFLHTEEGKQFIKDVEPFLGTSIIESGVDLKAKTPVYHPLGLFQMPEPLNRQVSVAAAYREAIKQGMSELAAKEFAIRANWAEQFTYNMANLPKIMRGPTGKLMTQFKPYLIKEIEFMSNLSGKEWLRYAGMQLALGGPRGYMMILKSLPILAAFGFWQEAMDIVEEWMNKNAPIASRGVGALPSLISPELGVDISAAATFQFPQGFWDFAGPALNDIGNIFIKVLKPLGTVGPYMEDVQKTGSIAPVMRHYQRLMEYTFSNDDWLRKENGDKLYEVKSAVPFIIQSIMGVENVDLNRIRAEQRILASRDERIGGIKTRLLNEAVNAIIAGKPIPESTRAKFGKYGITADSILGRIERAQLPPRARAILDAEVMQRRDAVEMFPTEEDFGQPLE